MDSHLGLPICSEKTYSEQINNSPYQTYKTMTTIEKQWLLSSTENKFSSLTFDQTMHFLALLGTHFLIKGVIFYIVKLTNSTAFNQTETLCRMLFEISNCSISHTCVFYINRFILSSYSISKCWSSWPRSRSKQGIFAKTEFWKSKRTFINLDKAFWWKFWYGWQFIFKVKSKNYLNLRLWDENRSLIAVRFFQRFQ